MFLSNSTVSFFLDFGEYFWSLTKKKKGDEFFLQQRSSKEIISFLVGIKMDLKTEKVTLVHGKKKSKLISSLSSFPPISVLQG